MFNLGRSLGAKVDSIINDGRWRWPRSRNATVKEIVDGTARDLVPKMDREDQVVWTLNSNGKYCAKSAWLAIRTTNSEVVWCPLVWFNKHVLRWSFILWVALLGRLSTKDRLQSWGIAMDSNCVLCHGGVEDHNHLFFYCSFS